MRAILDEQLSPQIAALLRKAGYDADSVTDHKDLAGRSDGIVFEVASSEGRALVIRNLKDFRRLAAEWFATICRFASRRPDRRDAMGNLISFRLHTLKVLLTQF